MRPERINEESSQEDFDGTAFIGAAQEDDRSVEGQLEIEFPVLRERTSWRRRVEAWRRSLPCSLHIAIRPVTKGDEILMLETAPDLLLPAAIIAFNGGLKSSFPGGREDRDHAELQTKTNHSAEGIAIHSIAQESGVIVKLGIFRQTVLAPVQDQRFDGELGRPARSCPTATETSMQADDVQNHDIDAALDDKAFHEIEAVELGLPGSHARQIPPFGRRRTANTCSSIKSTATQQNSTDRANGWNLLQTAIRQGAMNGSRAVLTEVTRTFEVLSRTKDQVLRTSRRCPGGTSSAARRIAPVNTVESLAVRPSHPFLNSRQSHPKFSRHRSQRLSASNGSNQATPLMLNPILFGSQFGP